MILPQYRIFFDTSVYIAALLSPGGAAGELVRLAEAGVIRMIVSEEVIVEADRVLAGNRLVFRFPICIDARWKPSYRQPVAFDPATVAAVDRKWNRLGIKGCD